MSSADAPSAKTHHALLDRLRAHAAARTHECGDPRLKDVPAEFHLGGRERFERELRTLHRRRPVAAAFVSELEAPGSYVTRVVAGVPVVVLRDASDGSYRCFANTCSHKGVKLCHADRGEGLRHLRCPFHGWTYDTRGCLVRVSGETDAFARASGLGLTSYPVVVRAGIVWTLLDPDASDEEVLGGLRPVLDEIEALVPGPLAVHRHVEHRVRSGWKLACESFMEAYHFPYAHPETIPDQRFPNLTLFETRGECSRIIVPMSNILEPGGRLTERTQIMYVVFPTTYLLVMGTMVYFLRVEPVGPGECICRAALLVPGGEAGVSEHAAIFDALQAILAEDIALCESSQRALEAGLLRSLQVTRFEQAVEHFHECIGRALT